jgi:CRP/FNR family cyclic AMP-dependent transcriptional regulator
MDRSDRSSGPFQGSPHSRTVGERANTGRRVLEWPSATQQVPEPESRGPARYCYLLDVDPDLADAFDIRTRLVVRQVATAQLFDVPVGSPWIDDLMIGNRGLGALVLDGLFAIDVHVGGRTATELLGPGDLLQPFSRGVDELLERDIIRRTLVQSRVAVLDGAFLDRVRAWPGLVLTLLRRSNKRAIDLNLQRAVSSHPSLELRLALLLWYLAERWGRVEPGGIHLELPLTHAMLGRLVAAERPSVSRSLGRLAEHGLVTGGAGDWHLAGSADACLSALGSRPVERLDDRQDFDSSAHHGT